MKILRVAVLALVATALNAHARSPVPIVNHENVAVERAGSQPASAEDVRKAIQAAALATGRKWLVTEAGPGRLVATYQVRAHTVVTEIQYTATHFSMRYRDSVNMKFAPGPEGDGAVIHPFYNRWVLEFLQAIRAELGRAA